MASFGTSVYIYRNSVTDRAIIRTQNAVCRWYTHVHKWLPEIKQCSPLLHVFTSKVSRQLTSRLWSVLNANRCGYIG